MMTSGKYLSTLVRQSNGKRFWTGITEQENLYKVGGSLKRLHQAEAYLWQGNVDATKHLFEDLERKQARNFGTYLDKHRHRLVNYEYFQAEQLCSIGSGAVESAVKQIDRRLNISGAQWK